MRNGITPQLLAVQHIRGTNGIVIGAGAEYQATGSGNRSTYLWCTNTDREKRLYTQTEYRRAGVFRQANGFFSEQLSSFQVNCSQHSIGRLITWNA